MNDKSSGFTLLELMIAITIVGILASLSVPTYQNYIIRAKVSEALSMAAVAKLSVSEYYINHGSLPASKEAAGIADISTKYLQSIAYIKSDDDGKIVLTLSDQVGTAANNKKIKLTATAENLLLKWTCLPSDKDGLGTQYLPSSCR